MKRWILLCLALLPMLARADLNPRLALPDFAALAKHASSSVTITLDASLLRMAGKFLDANDPDDAAVQQIIQGLEGIYVRSYSFDEDFDYAKAGAEGLLRQLTAPGWNRLIETRSKKTRADVDIYVMSSGNKALGLALIAREPRKFTVVNIVGSIDLDKLHRLEGHFGVPAAEGSGPAADKK